MRWRGRANFPCASLVLIPLKKPLLRWRIVFFRWYIEIIRDVSAAAAAVERTAFARHGLLVPGGLVMWKFPRYKSVDDAAGRNSGSAVRVRSRDHGALVGGRWISHEFVRRLGVSNGNAAARRNNNSVVVGGGPVGSGPLRSRPAHRSGAGPPTDAAAACVPGTYAARAKRNRIAFPVHDGAFRSRGRAATRTER